MVVVPNPNWPLLHVDADFTAGPPGTPGINRRALDKANGLIVSSISTKRGRQYELGQCEAGTATLTVADPKEVLNPGNAASPFMTGGNTILSRRQLQIWCLWNSSVGGVTGNILNTANPAPGQPNIGAAYGYDPSFETWNVVSAGSWVMSGDGTSFSTPSTLPSGPLNSNTGFETGIPPWVVTGGTVAQSTTQKHSGTYSAQLTPSGAAAQVYIESEKVTVTAGNLYCVNLWAWATNAVTTNFSASVNWYNASNVYLSTSSVNVSLVAATWTNVQNTFTAPAGAASGSIVPTLSGTPVAGQIFYIDDASLTNATNPADGSYQVIKGSFTANNSFIEWLPRVIPGNTYTLSMDVYTPTGVTAKLTYGGTSATNTVTGAYQTLSITVTAAAGTYWQLQATAAGAYPATLYFANWRITGLSPGWSQTAGSAMAYTQAQAHSGQFSLGTVMQASTDSMSLPLPTAPTITYTMSAWVYAVGAGSVVRMSVGGSTASSTVVGAWQRITATFTAVDAVTMVSWSAPSGTFPVTAYVDDIQLEAAATASTYTASGPTARMLHTGYVERFPQTWTMQGSRGLKPLESVDALSVLARTAISQSYASTILADSPTVYIPYADQAGPVVVQRPAGGQPMQGYTNLGSSGSPSVNFGGDTFLDGSRALTVVQQNANPPVSADATYVTYAGTQNGTVVVNPQSFTLECWVRFNSGTVYLGAAAVQPGENVNTKATGPQYFVGWYTTTGALAVRFTDPNGGRAGPYVVGNNSGFNGYPDGQWHYLAIVFPGGSTLQSVVDNAFGGAPGFGFTPSQAIALNNCYIDATTYYGDQVTSLAVAYMAMYPVALSSTQITNHYRRGSGYVGEVSGSRVARLLNRYWGSNYTVAQGYLKLAPDFYWNPVSTSGQSSAMSVLQAIQDIVVSENGLFYANGAGTLVFEDRVSRYQNQTSLWTFGERADLGELPYDNLEYDFDPTYVYSQVNLSRPGNSNFAPMVNSTAQNNYGQSILPRQLQASTDDDLKQAGIFYLNRYGQQRQRIRKMTISPAKNPALFTAVLSLEISNRVTVKRRTTAGVTISGDFYVESIAHHIVAREGQWTVELQLSPVFVPQAWVLGDNTYGVLGTTTVPVY